MAIRIVQDVPGGGSLRRIGRAIAVLLGLVLILAGLLAAVVPLLFLLIPISSVLGDGSDPPRIEAADVPAFAIVCGTAVIAPFIGRRLIRGRRRLGLFLRKFGLKETTRTVTSGWRFLAAVPLWRPGGPSARPP